MNTLFKGHELNDDHLREIAGTLAANMLDGLIETRSGLAAHSRGDVFSELRLDAGALSLGLPVGAHSANGNPRLRD